MTRLFPTPELEPAAFAARAGTVAAVLKRLANPHRLMIACKLVEHGEMTVGDLAAAVGLSQSALSQHLAKLREERLVAFRRERQTLWYRIADPRVEALLAALYQLYCKD
jgi:ArsR family transcriptional regulator, virulence genes transcriptional regulator